MIDSDRRRQFAERLHLATQLMVESKQKHGRVIIERYTLVLHLLQTNKECVYYELGRYYESLYTDAQEKRSLHDNNNNNKSTTTTGGQNSTSRNNNNNTNNNNTNSSVAVSFEDSSRYITKAISHYITCLQSNQSTMITQALPRMLTLWFSFTATSTSTTSSTGSTTNTNNTGSNTNNTSAGSGSGGDSVHLAKAQKAINEEVKKLATNPFVCFHCLPQLVSRLGVYIVYVYNWCSVYMYICILCVYSCCIVYTLLILMFNSSILHTTLLYIHLPLVHPYKLLPLVLPL